MKSISYHMFIILTTPYIKHTSPTFPTPIIISLLRLQDKQIQGPLSGHKIQLKIT